MRSLLRLAIVLVLVTTACRAEIAFVLDLDEEGTGTFGAEIGFDEEMRELLTAGGEEIDPDTIFEDFNLEGVPGASTRTETRDDLTVYVAEAPFTDLTELRADYIDDPESPFRSFDLNVGESETTLAAEIAFPDATGDLSSDELPFDPETLTEDIFKIAFRVHMPGTVTSHNADRVLPDGTLEWNLALTGATVMAEATSEYGGSSFPIWLIVLALIALVGIGLIVAATLRNRRVPAAAVAAAAAGAEADATGSVGDGPPAPYVETSAGVALGEPPIPRPADPFSDVTPPPVAVPPPPLADDVSTSDQGVRDAARASDEARTEAIRARDEAASEAIEARDAARGEAIRASDAAASADRAKSAAPETGETGPDDGDQGDEDVTGG